MIEIKVEVDLRTVDAWLETLNEKVFQKAMARSLNRAMTTLRKESSTDIRAGLKLKQATISEGLDISHKAKGTELLENMYAQLDVSSKPQSLLAFGARQTKRGVTVNVKGKRKTIAHAFIARMPNATSGVFIRKKLMLSPKKASGIATRISRKGNSHLPITKLYTTRISEVFGDKRGRYQVVAAERVKREFESNFKYYMEQSLK
jgi:hypothetical protein